MKGTKQMEYGDTQISSELWEDINFEKNAKEVDKLIKEGVLKYD